MNGGAGVLLHQALLTHPSISVHSQSVKNDPPGLELRFATPADAEVISAMVGDFAAYERLTSQSTPESVRHELARPDRVIEVVVAFVGGRPAGFAVFFPTYSTFVARRGLYLEDIFVRDEFRSRGVATALMRFIARVAVERNYGRVEFTVLLWNTVAIEFFEVLGATPNSAWTTYRLTGVWLHKLAAV